MPLESPDELSKALNRTFLTSVPVVSQAQASSFRPSLSFGEVGRPVPKTQRQVNSFVEEEDLKIVDNGDLPRCAQRPGKRPVEFILH